MKPVSMEELPLKRPKLQQMLQSVVQNFGWTYSLFWKLCPQQGLLVWGDGHYNGSIKTRKTVQTTAVSQDQMSQSERSEQLKELYQFLAADGDGGERRRPGLALSPEDLTECEWFYLMCISFSFAPGCGLPGKAFETQNSIWLTRANDTNSKVFSRTILAKSAGIQTVVCIPLTNGVLELGTEEMVEEDATLTQQARNIFADIHINSPAPARSEQSTSSPALECENLPMAYGMDDLCQLCEEVDNKKEDSNNDKNPDCEITKAYSESELEIGRMIVTNMSMTDQSESIKFGFADNGIIDSERSQLKNPEVAHKYSSVHSLEQDDKESYLAWYLLQDGSCNDLQHSPDSMPVTELPPQDVHYSQTVATILHDNISDFSEGSFISQLSLSDTSSFSKWFCENQIFSKTGASQWKLKYILFILPTIHNKKYLNSVHLKGKESGGWKGILQDETNGNHVLAERRRREKLNKRFMILRALVPCVTKMDKASILADTIEYVRHLTLRIHELELQNQKISNLLGSKVSDSHNQITSQSERLETNCSTLSASITQGKQELAHLPEAKKRRTIQITNNIEEATKAMDDTTISIQASIIESIAVLELQCPYKNGILLKIMQKLDELNLEITSINSAMVNGNFIAEFKAKIKGPYGRRANVEEIKRTIHELLSH
ncbi:basic helix-loop-helix protein A [Dendrobium catenatum]|uniref:basic helix-loop-helix protein A n=1 Tax=Dendrobium catenatum TaxID=906689 RepID=UPI0009F29BD4|nr:basic helix-loop-helix protein A [Dendrobium catenatum]